MSYRKEKMKVKLLNFTPDCEQIIAKAAKLCYSSSSIDDLEARVDGQDIAGFIEKLMGMGHDSPLEHVCFTFAVEGVSRVLTHQLVRHRIASYSQQSQRYVRLDNTFEFIIPPSIEKVLDASNEYYRLIEVIHKIYKALLGAGIPAEDARYILPNATETKIIFTMNARVLLHFFKVRCCNRAQWEIRGMAQQMLMECKKVAPLVFKHAGPGCINHRCPEGEMSCGKQDEVRELFRSL
jgi:thymidylate synthase (FAD)